MNLTIGTYLFLFLSGLIWASAEDAHNSLSKELSEHHDLSPQYKRLKKIHRASVWSAFLTVILTFAAFFAGMWNEKILVFGPAIICAIIGFGVGERALTTDAKRSLGKVGFFVVPLAFWILVWIRR
ncbi:hypothetical protein [Dyella humicola]|uniref:hypothetical protein n=1 Tax=Dyella humicola TaxID=2992126 RepID=UPI00224FA5E6|nr:hypothetical protein [Dyella humicola]